MKEAHAKFSDPINISIDVINWPCIIQVQHVLNLAKKQENVKFSIPLNLVTLNYNKLFGVCNELFGICNELFGICNELFAMCSNKFIWNIQ